MFDRIYSIINPAAAHDLIPTTVPLYHIHSNNIISRDIIYAMQKDTVKGGCTPDNYDGGDKYIGNENLPYSSPLVGSALHTNVLAYNHGALWQHSREPDLLILPSLLSLTTTL